MANETLTPGLWSVHNDECRSNVNNMSDRTPGCSTIPVFPVFPDSI